MFTLVLAHGVGVGVRTFVILGVGFVVRWLTGWVVGFGSGGAGFTLVLAVVIVGHWADNVHTLVSLFVVCIRWWWHWVYTGVGSHCCSLLDCSCSC